MDRKNSRFDFEKGRYVEKSEGNFESSSPPSVTDLGRLARERDPDERIKLSILYYKTSQEKALVLAAEYNRRYEALIREQGKEPIVSKPASLDLDSGLVLRRR